MVISRRSVILGAGGVAALVAAGGMWKVTRAPQTATLPWHFDPAPLPDVRLDAFRFAILAPNPHNRQPWLIRMDGADAALLSCDPDKRLPATDPFDRQTVIGFGTFIELAAVAAAERGVRMDVELFPAGEPQPRLDRRPVARLRFTRDAAIPRDPLFAQITRRRSNKDAYDLARAVRLADIRRIMDGDAQSGSTDAKLTSAARAIVLDAVRIEQETSRTHLESVRLIRLGHDQVDANPDGIDVAGPMIETLKLAGQIDHAALADPQSMASRSGAKMMVDTYGSIPALVWIKMPGNSRADQVEAGRRYVRANLRATALGLSMHPMSQSLQEFPEMAGPFMRVQSLLGATGEQRIQMLARIGYGPTIGPSPRWPLEKHLIA